MDPAAVEVPPTIAPDIAILGAGAIGQLLCHQLLQAGERVAFIGRDPAPTKDISLGISLNISLEFCPLKGPEQRYRVPLMDRAQLGQLRLLLVCVKAHQVVDALTPLLNELDEGCQLVLLHNGMGPHLALSPLIAGRSLTLGTTSQGALRQSPWHTRQTGTGLTQLGHFQGPKLSPEFKALLLEAIPGSEWVDDILPCLWQKLAVNAAINPLSAIHDCPNGALAAPEFAGEIAAVIDELLCVAAADGITLERTALLERVYSVIALTAGNYSSMVQDLRHGRMTEIDSINGYLCRCGEVHGLNTQVNRRLWQQVLRLQRHP
jgi:2-dehydropantoate 2-reductase